ncbi:DNA-binding protein [Deinococcus cellulosilyticus NBRC 106333 = KACC 11606]|uniref:DNA-binding protein n=1 Tax=Deinococcus cellulosilyticus (strain DSM 18568 / NBRC 106333 / KACC 11606 / 5516J-15) TaxID=1223518 RepID=A0A511N0U7_DEIC1|nr:DNA-binding protein [Deinococcus cellulosilyticus NBRC 106333 = KACC 11606]
MLALLNLKFTRQLGNRRIRRLVEHFGNAQEALKAKLADLRGIEGMDSRVLQHLGSSEAAARAALELERARKVGVRLLGLTDPDYPRALRALSDPPAVLWVRGDLPMLEVVPKAIGVVGTRKCSAWALQFARSLSRDLTQAGVMVVSGLARGIDTAAHQACIEAGGVTVGVLGSGVDNIYPSENRRLVPQMVLVSEHPLGTRPMSHHFPERNRIIAALSAGSVVIEGEVTSGSMITAHAALECGRTVFAVPGRAGDPLAAGPHKLLREGAVLVEGAEDILLEMGWKSLPKLDLQLPEEQARIYTALDAPRTLDDVLVLTGMDAGEAQVNLMMLTLSGVVMELSGGRYARV